MTEHAGRPDDPIHVAAQPADGRHEFVPLKFRYATVCGFEDEDLLAGYCGRPADDPVHVATQPAEVPGHDFEPSDYATACGVPVAFESIMVILCGKPERDHEHPFHMSSVNAEGVPRCWCGRLASANDPVHDVEPSAGECPVVVGEPAETFDPVHVDIVTEHDVLYSVAEIRAAFAAVMSFHPDELPPEVERGVIAALRTERQRGMQRRAEQ